MFIDTVVVGPIETNCYIVANDAGRCVIIDPGAEPEKIMTTIRSRGWQPAAIINTHGHYDHILADMALQREFDIPIYFPAHDDYLIGLQKKIYWLDDFAPNVQYVDTLSIEGFSIKVIATPGHTTGSSCLLFGTHLFTGDMLFADGYLGRTDLWGGSATAIQESLKTLLVLSDDIIVYPGHGSTSTIGQERQNHGR